MVYHGVLAPHSGWRARVVAYRVSPAETAAVASAAPEVDNEPARGGRHWAWADLMRRAFDIDVLACPRCGGRLRLIAAVEDPDAVRAILDALARSASAGVAGRAPPPASQTAAPGAERSLRLSVRDPTARRRSLSGRVVGRRCLVPRQFARQRIALTRRLSALYLGAGRLGAGSGEDGE